MSQARVGGGVDAALAPAAEVHGVVGGADDALLIGSNTCPQPARSLHRGKVPLGRRQGTCPRLGGHQNGGSSE